MTIDIEKLKKSKTDIENEIARLQAINDIKHILAHQKIKADIEKIIEENS